MDQKQLKTALRKEIRARLKEMTPEQCKKESDCIWQQLCDESAFKEAKTILLYWSLDNEVDTHAFIEEWCDKKTILLPVVNGDTLDLKVYEGIETMKEGAYGILEPTGAIWTDFNKIDLCIIPGVAFDKSGHRMGHGKGYYDRLLEHLKTEKIGVCYSTQIVEEIPTDPWDKEMSAVIYGKPV